MSSDPNKKSARTIQCRDMLWEMFEQMAHELECSVDYLVNEAMKQYARQRSAAARPAFPPGRSEPPPEPGRSRRALPSPPPPPLQPNGPMASNAMYAPPFAHGSVPPRDTLPPPHRTASGLGAAPGRPSGPPPPPPPPPHRAGGLQSGVAVNPSLRMTPSDLPPLGYPSRPPPPAAPRNSPPPTVNARPTGPAGTSRSVPPPHAAFGALPPRNAPLSVVYQGEKVAISKDRFVIGRGKQQSDLTVKDPNVSRQHAMIEFQNGVYFMVDMGSTNGVEFNGQRIARKQIAEGDVFRICDHELQFTYR